MDYNKFKNKKFIITFFVCLVVCVSSIYFGVQFAKEGYSNLPELRQRQSELDKKVKKEQSLQADVNKIKDIKNSISEQEKREKELADSITKEFPQLESLENLGQKAYDMQSDLKSIIDDLDISYFVIYDSDFARRIDKSLARNIQSAMGSFIFKGFGGALMTEQYDNTVKTFFSVSTNELTSYVLDLQDCVINLEELIFPNYYKLNALSQVNGQLQTSDIFIPEYEKIQKTINNFESFEFKKIAQQIYDKLYLLKINAQLFSSVSQLVMDNDVMMSNHISGLTGIVKRSEQQMNNLHKKYNVSLSDEVKQQANEILSKRIDEFVNMIVQLDSIGCFSAGVEFFDMGASMNVYRQGDSSSDFLTAYKDKTLVFAKHKNKGDLREYYIYDKNGKPTLIFLKNKNEIVYAYDGNAVYANVANSDIYVNHALKIRDAITSDDNNARREFLEYYKNESQI